MESLRCRACFEVGGFGRITELRFANDATIGR